MKRWYDPRSWFKKAPEVPKEVLYCDNPQCRQLIDDKEIAYSGAEKEIYHIGDCALFASAHRVVETGLFSYANLDYITINDALKLKSSGKLKQPSLSQYSGLEEKIE